MVRYRWCVGNEQSYSIVLYSTVQYSTVQYSTVQLRLVALTACASGWGFLFELAVHSLYTKGLRLNPKPEINIYTVYMLRV